MRLRVVPVLGTSPSIFGHALASYVLCHIAGQLSSEFDVLVDDEINLKVGFMSLL